MQAKLRTPQGSPVTDPLQAIRNFYDANIRPVQEDVEQFLDDAGDVIEDVAGAASDVGGAIVDGAEDVATAVNERGIFNVVGDVFTQQVTQGVDVLGELTRRSPGDFVNWLTGPEGPSFADTTAMIPGLQQAIGDVMDTAMGNPMIAGAVGQAFGFEYVPGQDFYTTNEGSLQSYFGFHDAYDKVGKLLGMDLDDQVVEVEVDGVEYRLELWQGSYGDGGAFGGEIGFYTRGAGDRGWFGNLLENIPGYYSSASGENQIGMTQTIYNTETGQEYFTNNGAGADDGAHYWNLAIRTDPGVNHEDIGQRGELVLNDAEVGRALHAQMVSQGIDAQISSDGLTITYDWP